MKYQIRGGVDDKCEIINSTEVTAGSVNEANRLKFLLKHHHQTTVYVDTGIRIANNTGLAFFLQSVLPDYGFQWSTGEDKLFMVLVGTGLRTPTFNTGGITSMVMILCLS